MWIFVISFAADNFSSHPILSEDAVHPLGEGLLLDCHPLLLQLPDPPCPILHHLHPGRIDGSTQNSLTAKQKKLSFQSQYWCVSGGMGGEREL